MCGACSDDVCELQGAPHNIMWGRGASDRLPDGSVRGVHAYWYCERAFQLHYRHQQTRAELKAAMSADRRIFDTFHARRKDLLERKASGQRAAAADRRTKVVKTQGWRDHMLGPRDQFWEIGKYRRKFGSPSARENKKRRHQATKYHGTEGVLVPP